MNGGVWTKYIQVDFIDNNGYKKVKKSVLLILI